MKKVAVVTGSRAEYGLLYLTMQKIRAHSDLQLRILATGSHLSREHGYTLEEIKRDGFEVDDTVDILPATDTGTDIARAIGRGTEQFSGIFERLSPDLLLILGDRFELLSVVSAALPQLIPVAHIHGGESTEGSIDESIRHSITKMSHLHFPAIKPYADRIRQLGEEDWRIHVVGAPGVERIEKMDLPDESYIETELNIDLSEPTLLVIFHPVTLEPDQVRQQIVEITEALRETSGNLLFVLPNTDTGNQQISYEIKKFVNNNSRARAYPNLERKLFVGLLSRVDLMVGNSSSGIIEAPCFELPFVNVGNRQKNRIRGKNVIDVSCDRDEIREGIKRGLDPSFRKELDRNRNPYRKPGTSRMIVDQIAGTECNDRLLKKKFVDR